MGTLKMKISITFLGAASAGIVSYEKPITPRSRGHSFCIGCDAATDGQWPWQVSLQRGTSHFCGGSVLSATKVASAAHCLQAEFNIRAGSVDSQDGGQYVAGARFVPHPAYNSALIIKDYGVITTATSFTFNDFLQPIALVSPSVNRPAEGTSMITSGFGLFQLGPFGRPIQQVSQYLLYTDINYVSVESCQNAWDGVATIDESVVCADKSGVSICSGDSGGPLVIQEDGEWKLIGATSWAHSRCNVNRFPQGWANIQDPTYNEWMRVEA